MMVEMPNKCVMEVVRMEKKENSNIYRDKGLETDEMPEFMKCSNSQAR